MCQKNLAASRLADFEYFSSRALSIPRRGVIFFYKKRESDTWRILTHAALHIRAYKHTRLT